MTPEEKFIHTKLLTQVLEATSLGFLAGRGVPNKQHKEMIMAAHLMAYQGLAALEEDPETALDAAVTYLRCTDSRRFMAEIRAKISVLSQQRGDGDED